MARIGNPLPIFLDPRGALLDAGSIYVGTVGEDPEIEANRIATWFDAAMTIEATQPLRTLGGMIVNGADPSFVYANAEDWSFKVVTADGETVCYLPSVAEAAPQYQPLDSDLTAIAALSTSAFGRNLLTLANAAALKSAAGIVDGLATTGGTITGNITRQGAGVYSYWADAGLTSGREFLSPAAGADPTSQPGDKWFGY